jgi:hypothetical protein
MCASIPRCSALFFFVPEVANEEGEKENHERPPEDNDSPEDEYRIVTGRTPLNVILLRPHVYKKQRQDTHHEPTNACHEIALPCLLFVKILRY